MKIMDKTSSRLAISVLIGIAVVAIDSGVRSIVLEQPLDLRDEAGVLAFQALLVSIPFLLLTMVGINDKLSWLLGISMTLFFWGILLSDAINRSGDGTGANIGLGLLLLVSPVIITIFCLAVAKKDKNASS